jgi:hypothetical protein
MTGFFVHIDLPLNYSLIMAHTELGAGYPVRSEVIYPQPKAPKHGRAKERECPPAPVPVPARIEQAWSMPRFDYPRPQPGEHEFVYWQEGLVFIRREEGELVLEPESANWMLLSGAFATMFRELKRPIPYGYILCNAFISREEAGRFIDFCLAHNFLRLENRLVLYEPLAVAPFESPDTCVVELSRAERGKAKHSDSTLVARVIDELFASRVLVKPRLELHSASLHKDRDLIAECMALVERGREKEFKDLEMLLVVPGKLDRSQAAFLAWHGIKVRLCLEDLKKNEKEALNAIRAAGEEGILESISVTIDDPSDFPLLEQVITEGNVHEVRVVVAPLSSASWVMPADYAPIMAHNLVALGENCAASCTSGSGSMPVIEPLATLVNNLVSSTRRRPCFPANRHPMSARVCVDAGGMVFSCEGSAKEKRARGTPIHLAGPHLAHGQCHRGPGPCPAKPKECGPCPLRNFCPGICPAAGPRVSVEDSCRMHRILIPELMIRGFRGQSPFSQKKADCPHDSRNTASSFSRDKGAAPNDEQCDNNLRGSHEGGEAHAQV